MRKALLVGVNHYDNEKIEDLQGSINDVEYLHKLLKVHIRDIEGNEEPNFHCKVLTSSKEKKSKITRRRLQGEIKTLLNDEETDVALFYFSGHGYENSLGGYLVTQDASQYEEGVAFNDIMIHASNSSIKEIIIILDCCRSGILGEMSILKNHNVVLPKGVSILTSSTSVQDSMEECFRGIYRGVFTTLICNALAGGNTDILGNVKITHLYEHADRMLGPWDQRPTLKTNSSRLTVLRKSEPKIPYNMLKKLTTYFKSSSWSFQLNPSFDPELEPKDTNNEKAMRHLRKYYSYGLVRPANEKYMYHAAKNSDHCILTSVGQQYWHLIDKGLL